MRPPQTKSRSPSITDFAPHDGHLVHRPLRWEPRQRFASQLFVIVDFADGAPVGDGRGSDGDFHGQRPSQLDGRARRTRVPKATSILPEVAAAERLSGSGAADHRAAALEAFAHDSRATPGSALTPSSPAD